MKPVYMTQAQWNQVAKLSNAELLVFYRATSDTAFIRANGMNPESELVRAAMREAHERVKQVALKRALNLLTK